MKRLLLALPLLLLAAFAGVALWRLSSPPDNIIRSKLEGQPVEGPIPEQDGTHQDQPLRYGVVVRRHRVLRRVGDEHDREEIRHSDGPGLSPENAEREEQEEVND